MQILILCLYVPFNAEPASVALGYMVQCDILIELCGLPNRTLSAFPEEAR
jgi:hypothetical protein